jgi:hypothetical protein
MKKYVIQRTMDGKFYKHTRSRASWVDKLEKAKVYNQLNHPSCAINMMKQYWRGQSWVMLPKAFKILVFEVEMIPKEVIEVE